MRRFKSHLSVHAAHRKGKNRRLFVLFKLTSCCIFGWLDNFHVIISSSAFNTVLNTLCVSILTKDYVQRYYGVTSGANCNLNELLYFIIILNFISVEVAQLTLQSWHVTTRNVIFKHRLQVFFADGFHDIIHQT